MNDFFRFGGTACQGFVGNKHDIKRAPEVRPPAQLDADLEKEVFRQSYQ
jgi:hypothetical protein